jgi:PAS domain S-box-containing protein
MRPPTGQYDLLNGTEALFEHMPRCLFFVKDRRGRFLAVNGELLRLFGSADADDVLGRTDADFLPDYIAEKYRQDDIRLLQDGQPTRNRVELITTSDGIVDWIITTKVPVRNVTGDIVAVAGFAREYRGEIDASTMPKELRDAILHIRTRFNEPLTVPYLARLAGRSVSAFQRLFKRRLHMSPTEFLRIVRVHEACRRLLNSQDTLARIASDCGFSDQSHLSRQFKRVMRTTPAAYRSSHCSPRGN